MANALTVGITADRRWQEQADLFSRRGIECLHGPSMRTIDLGNDAQLRAATTALIAEPPDWLVATTGMGMKKWLEAADGWGVHGELMTALSRARAVARGAKSTSAVRQAGLQVEWSAPGESMAEVVEFLGAQTGIDRERVAVQLFDLDEHASTSAVKDIAGDVVEVPVYRWLLPDDPAPARELIDACISGRLGAVTFTSQPAVRFLFRIAEDDGNADALRAALNDGGVLPACIGPVCADAATEVGISDPVWPEPFRLPRLVQLVAERLAPR